MDFIEDMLQQAGDFLSDAGFEGAIIGGLITGFFACLTTWYLVRVGREDKDLERQLEIRIMISSLRSELKVVWDHYTNAIGDAIEVQTIDQLQRSLIGVLSERYSVYDAVISRIAIVPSDKLRHDIIYTFTCIRAVYDDFTIHTQFVTKFVQYNINDPQYEELNKITKTTSITLKASHMKTKEAVVGLLQSLQPWAT